MAADPNPVRGIWYADALEPMPDAPCYGCRRGMRRGHVVTGDGVVEQHHLVREGVTIDCTGTAFLIEKWCDERPEFERVGDDASFENEST